MSEENNNFENSDNTNNSENINENTGNAENISEPDNSETAAAESSSDSVTGGDFQKTPDTANADAALSIDPENNTKRNIITAVIAAAVVIILAAAAIMYSMDVFETNKYNKMGYINISGRTIDDLAESAGVSLEEFKERNGLPEDMTGDTDESAAFYNMPAENVAQMYNMDFNTLKEFLQLPDTVNEKTPWGEAEGEALLKNYIGEESIDSFKEEYGFGDDITGDTKWKEVRNKVDQAMLEERKKQEREAAKATPQASQSPDGNQELSEEELQALIDQAVNSSDGTASTSGNAENNTQAPAAENNVQAPAANQ